MVRSVLLILSAILCLAMFTAEERIIECGPEDVACACRAGLRELSRCGLDVEIYRGVCEDPGLEKEYQKECRDQGLPSGTCWNLVEAWLEDCHHPEDAGESYEPVCEGIERCVMDLGSIVEALDRADPKQASSR
jgi:hypothetical protein